MAERKKTPHLAGVISELQIRGKILVVEDEPILRMSAVDVLTEAGFDVTEAATADQAISILETHPDIHVVFSDIEMPGSMDGIKLCHYIRERWPPVILIVASGKVIEASSQLPSGAMFFPKPYHHPTIVETIHNVLGQWV